MGLVDPWHLIVWQTSQELNVDVAFLCLVFRLLAHFSFTNDVQSDVCPLQRLQ